MAILLNLVKNHATHNDSAFDNVNQQIQFIYKCNCHNVLGGLLLSMCACNEPT